MFSSKELYMMNAGDKRYIFTDGFADVYQATPQEEASWKSELITRKMEVIRAESNPFSLKQAIETLSFHHYEKTTEYIRDQISQSGPGKQIVLAEALWASTRYHESFALLCLHFAQDPVSYRDDFFLAMQEFYNHSEARKFAIDCVEGNDADLYTRAIALLTQWQSKGIFRPAMSEVTEGLRQRTDFTTVAPYMAQLRQLLGIYNDQQPI